MFVLEKTYDIDELLRCNMHTHTSFSLCAKPEMVFENMVRTAEESGIKVLAITDHNDPGSAIDVLGNTAELKKRLTLIDTDVRVLIGSELSAYGVGKYVDSDELNAALDYRNYSCVHYHLDTWEQPEDRSPAGYGQHMIKVLEALFKTGRADSIAHPFSPIKMDFFNDEEKRNVLSSIPDNALGDIMEKGERAGCAWELHKATCILFPDFSRRFFNIGREAGVHFTFGTDAHRLAQIPTLDFVDELKKILGVN